MPLREDNQVIAVFLVGEDVQVGANVPNHNMPGTAAAQEHCRRRNDFLARELRPYARKV